MYMPLSVDCLAAALISCVSGFLQPAWVIPSRLLGHVHSAEVSSRGLCRLSENTVEL